MAKNFASPKYKLKGKSVRLELNWELPFNFRLETKYLDWGEWNYVTWNNFNFVEYLIDKLILK